MKPTDANINHELTIHSLQLIKPFLFSDVIALSPIKSAFEDSTNHLWRVTLSSGKQAVLKVCGLSDVDDSDFWIGMEALFNVNYPLRMGEYAQVYTLLENNSDLAIPELLGCDSATKTSAGFIYCSNLTGHALTSDAVNSDMVQQLAVHLAKLHQVQSPNFGALFNPQESARTWWAMVTKTIELLADKKGVTLSNVDFENQQACPKQFVPIMPDLRWDQFLSESNKLTGLVDLDAIVFGAVELEFVLLEYLLTDTQAKLFKQSYSIYHSIPDLTHCRGLYRWLLFFMNVLGEKSSDAWMQAPKRF